MNEQNLFGKNVWKEISKQPLGSLPKRELELIILKAALDSKLISNHPAGIAASFKLSILKANNYLTEIGLRNHFLSDKDALAELILIMTQNEIITKDSHLSVPIANVNLRIWIERKIALINLNPGETTRKDIIKLTPLGLLRILDNSSGICTPYEAIDKLKFFYEHEPWFKEAKARWSPRMTWTDSFAKLSELTTIASEFTSLIEFLKIIL